MGNVDNGRKLASVQRIKNIRAMENADKLEKANVEGFQIVVPKNMYKENELIVFFEADSFLPIEDRYSFLSSSLRENEKMGKGYRIKVQKLRGEFTEGLVMSLSDFPEIKNTEEGLDVTDILNIKKWNISNEDALVGKGASKPIFVPTTDEVRIQSAERLLEEIKGRRYYISTKIDGMSVSMYYRDGEFGVTSRKCSVEESENNNIWKYVRKNNIKEKLEQYSKDKDVNVIIQGEFAGPGIQKNNLGLEDFEYFVFNVFVEDEDKNRRMLSLDEMVNFAKEVSLNTVPIEEVGDNFNLSLEDLYKKAQGKYENGHIKEGIVVRPVNPVFSDKLFKELSFKVLNNEYWAKEE